MSHLWMPHVTHINKSCHKYDWVMSHIRVNRNVTHASQPVTPTSQPVMSHTWMSHVTHVNESCHTHESTGCLVSTARQAWAEVYIYIYIYIYYMFDMTFGHDTSLKYHFVLRYGWHDSFICVTWPIHRGDMTHLFVWHDSFIKETWLIHMCDIDMFDMTWRYVWHDFKQKRHIVLKSHIFSYLKTNGKKKHTLKTKWKIEDMFENMFDMTSGKKDIFFWDIFKMSFVFLFLSRRIMSKSYVTHMNEWCHTHVNEWCVCAIYVWRVCDVTHSYMCDVTHSYVCVTCLIHMCVTCVWRHSFISSWHTSEWVTPHIWMSHGTHMNESCHTYEWVTSHIYE